MTATMKVKITPSTGNVFRDLKFGHEEAEHLLVRTDPHDTDSEAHCLPPSQAENGGKVLRVTQPRVEVLQL